MDRPQQPAATTRQPETGDAATRQQGNPHPDTYNPWSIVSLVFHHLADAGLEPRLGDSGDPGAPAAALLRTLGIEPAAEGNRKVAAGVRDHLAEIRAAFEDGRSQPQ